MTNSFGSLIQQFQTVMSTLRSQFSHLNSALKDISTANNPELAETIAAFKLQNDYTTSTDNLLKTVPIGGNATLANLTTAINLVQLYFQGTQPLNSILANLVDLLERVDAPSLPASTSIEDIREKISQMLSDRGALQKFLNRVLRDFNTEISDLNLKSLLQRSNAILSALDKLKNQVINLTILSPVIDDLTDHLKTAAELFKSFNRKGEDLTGNEPNEIKQLVLNWGDAIGQIEELEKSDGIKADLSDGSKGRSAIARSIQLHDLLEANYDYLTALIRSGDLESVGIL